MHPTAELQGGNLRLIIKQGLSRLGIGCGAEVGKAMTNNLTSGFRNASSFGQSIWPRHTFCSVQRRLNEIIQNGDTE
jgi:hypothetical protein